MRGMVQVTLVRGSEETLEDPATNVVESRLVDFTTTEFPIGEMRRVTCFLVGGHICFTSMELVAVRFVCPQQVVRRYWRRL